jgi:hypothetical protein
MVPAACPKCAAARTVTAAGPAIRCEQCGLVFAKWIDAQAGRSPAHAAEGGSNRADAEDAGSGWRAGPIGALISAITDTPAPMSQGSRIGHALLLAGLFVYGWRFILGDVASGEAWSNFLHGVNLVFHEAGHVLMMPFGQFIHVLGGTLGQLVMPLVVCCAFLVTRRDAAGASVGLWWFGQSLTDCAPYIADARKLELVLFDDALRHLIRISRILAMPRGCGLLHAGVPEPLRR